MLLGKSKMNGEPLSHDARQLGSKKSDVWKATHGLACLERQLHRGLAFVLEGKYNLQRHLKLLPQARRGDDCKLV